MLYSSQEKLTREYSFCGEKFQKWTTSTREVSVNGIASCDNEARKLTRETF
jgi:hypothetical protein